MAFLLGTQLLYHNMDRVLRFGQIYYIDNVLLSEAAVKCPQGKPAEATATRLER